MIKDIPIIFSGPMVRALLDGRKTMTRRIVKPQPEICFDRDGHQLSVGLIHVEGDPRPRVTLGRVITEQQILYAAGDRLWVRENLAAMSNWGLWHDAGPVPGSGQFLDDLDERGKALLDRYAPAEATDSARVPSIHMPRWASRLTLIVTGVKIERLQNISEADAEAEGVTKIRDGCYAIKGFDYDTAGLCHSRATIPFAKLWMHLHGEESWEANPYVVAITFTVHKQNIDTLPKAEAA